MTEEADKGWVDINLDKPAAPIEAIVEPTPTAEPAQAEVAPAPEETPKDQPSKGIDRRIRKALEAKTQAERIAAEKEAMIQDLQKRLADRDADANRRENVAISTYRQGVEAKLTAAKKAFADAYKSGDDQALVAAQEALGNAQIELRDIDKWEAAQKATPSPASVPAPAPVPPPVPQIPEEAVQWCNANPWFGTAPGKDMMATKVATYISDSLVNEGYDPNDREFYEEVNRRLVAELPRMAKVLGQDNRQPEPKVVQPRSPVAAPSRRSSSGNKVRIDERQVAMASRLGLPLEEYAYQQHRLDNEKDSAGYTPITLMPRK